MRYASFARDSATGLLFGATGGTTTLNAFSSLTTHTVSGVPFYAMQYIAGHGLEVILDDLRRLTGLYVPSLDPVRLLQDPA